MQVPSHITHTRPQAPTTALAHQAPALTLAPYTLPQDEDATYYAARNFSPGTHYLVTHDGVMLHLGNAAVANYGRAFAFGRTVLPPGTYFHKDSPRYMFEQRTEG